MLKEDTRTGLLIVHAINVGRRVGIVRSLEIYSDRSLLYILAELCPLIPIFYNFLP